MYFHSQNHTKPWTLYHGPTLSLDSCHWLSASDLSSLKAAMCAAVGRDFELSFFGGPTKCASLILFPVWCICDFRLLWFQFIGQQLCCGNHLDLPQQPCWKLPICSQRIDYLPFSIWVSHQTQHVLPFSSGSSAYSTLLPPVCVLIVTPLLDIAGQLVAHLPYFLSQICSFSNCFFLPAPDSQWFVRRNTQKCNFELTFLNICP